MPELSAGAGAGFAEPTRARSRRETEEKSPKLVSRRESAGFLLGPGPSLSSHRAHRDELRAARSVAAGAARGPGKPLAPPRAKSSGAQSRAGRNGPRNRFAAMASTL